MFRTLFTAVEEAIQDATEAALTAKIDAEKNPITEAGLPWVSA